MLATSRIRRGVELSPGVSRRGFTLLEMLIVIAIIMFLMGLLAVTLFGFMGRNKATATWARIQVIDAGLERFLEEFPTRTINAQLRRGFPQRNEFPSVGSIDLIGMTDGEWLRVLLFPTDAEIDQIKVYGITKRVLNNEEVRGAVNSRDIDWEGRLIEAGTCFVDAWEQPIFYRAPGADHTAETNIKGQNGLNHREMNGKPDVWSIGNDGINWYRTDNQAQWASQVNDPTNSEAQNDDIANWFPVDKY